MFVSLLCTDLIANSTIADMLAAQRRILPHMTKLRNFRFTCLVSAHILDILPLLPDSDWDTIRASIVDSKEDGSEVPWQAIDAALAVPRFRSLRRFAIDLRLPTTVKIGDLMPLAQARGILE
jgi:hypothetical protein